MNEGLTHFFEHRTTADDASKWRGELDPVEVSVQPPPVFYSSNDPKFVDRNTETGEERRNGDGTIGYISADGLHWYAKCKSHLNGLTITFTFQHIREGESNVDHESDTIEFLDWNRQPFILRAESVLMEPPLFKQDVNFSVKRK